MINCDQLGSRYRLVSIAALNGKIYDVCLYWDLYNVVTKEYIFRYPDKIEVDGGYLVKDSSLTNRYNFVPGLNGNGNGVKKDKDTDGNKRDKVVDEKEKSQIIPGVDNWILIALGAFLLLKD